MSARSTVFVVDDDPGALRSMRWLLQQADLPVEAFSSGRVFLDAFDHRQPGCLVLDIRMPDLCGLEVQRMLIERGVRVPIIFLTAHGDVPTCARAFKGGAFDFLEKPVDDEVLLEHVRRALERDAAERREGVVVDFGARIAKLTPRERVVFDLLTSGKSLKEIAAATKVSVATAWKHRAAIFRKTGVENDVELARAATRCGYHMARQ